VTFRTIRKIHPDQENIMKTLTRMESMTRELMRDIDDYFASLDSQAAARTTGQEPAS
jgi:arsenate reductase-like glutaredoxin family protein